jgi:hypothetical protein
MKEADLFPQYAHEAAHLSCKAAAQAGGAEAEGPGVELLL